jgi:hypothetical protein
MWPAQQLQSLHNNTPVKSIRKSPALLVPTNSTMSFPTIINDEPPTKRYRYSVERHPYRIFENFFDDLEDDDNDDDDGDELDHEQEQCQEGKATCTACDTVPNNFAKAGTPRVVSVASMVEEVADQQHKKDTTTEKRKYSQEEDAAAVPASSAASTSIPANDSLQHEFKLASSEVIAVCTNKNDSYMYKNNSAGSLPSLTHSSASSSSHLYELAKDMILEEKEELR